MNKNNQSSSLQDGNKGNEMAEDRLRERKIYRVTVLGSIINVLLVALKFAFGVLGRSSAMIADAVHSLSDLVTDVVVIVFVKLSNKPQDSDHDYGHGKYETLATAFIGLALFAVGIMILYGGAEKIAAALRGEVLPQPGMIALWAALISIVSKEWCYRFTVRVGRSRRPSWPTPGITAAMPSRQSARRSASAVPSFLANAGPCSTQSPPSW